jgi:transposase
VELLSSREVVALSRFVGGELQARFMARVRGADPAACLVVPIDVGKWSAMALIADHLGEIVVAPFEFGLDEPGVLRLLGVIEAEVAARSAVICRVGVEAAGHYHRTVVARLRAAGVEVVELNPAQVKEARAQQLLRRLKSDERDLGAMAELMIRGAGRLPQVRDEALASQVAWVAHRRRKVAAHVALSNQIQGHLDLVFPGLGACFDGILSTKSGRVLVRDLADPDRMRRLGLEGLVGFVARRGVQLRRAKAQQLLDAAGVALRLPPAERAPIAGLLAADVALLDALDREIDRAEAALAEVLPATPAGVLTSLPGIGTIRASAYGAAIGDPDRFPNAGAAYRASGLVPTEYSSAGRARGGQHISREGSVELRTAIIELGRGLAGHEPDFAAYRRRLRSEGKRPMVAAVAVGHRAHRLAFAMLRTQQPYDPTRWAAAVAGGPVMAKTGGRPTRTT